MAAAKVQSKAHSAVQFAKQAEQLSLFHPSKDDNQEASQTTAVEAKFITESDPVIEVASGDRLPAVPLTEAQKLNELRDKLEGRDSRSDGTATGGLNQDTQKARAAAQRSTFQDDEPQRLSSPTREKQGAALQDSVPPSRTNPLFPPLPLYGPASLLRNIQCHIFRITSFFLSLGFLAVIVLGAAFTSIPLMFKHIGMRLRFKDPDSRRPFYKLEKTRRRERKEAEKHWRHQKKRRRSRSSCNDEDKEDDAGWAEEFIPTEGGKDPLVCSVGYYARRVGLDIEEFKVQTEDGFIIDLWHVYNPKEYIPGSPKERNFHSPGVFQDQGEKEASRSRSRARSKKYPVLMIHGLLQSAGAYCTNDDDSLAFFLAKRYVFVTTSNSLCDF